MGQESHPSNGLHPTTATTTTTTTTTPPFRRCAAEYHSVLQCAQRERTKNDFASFHIWCRPHMREFTRCMQDAQWKDLKSSFSRHPEHEQQQQPQELPSSFYWTTTATNNMARRWTRVRELLQDELVDEPDELPIRRAKDIFETLLCNEEKDTEREALVQQQQTDTGNDTIQIPITVGRRVQQNDDDDEIRKTINPAKRDDYYNENLFPFTNKDGSNHNLATATTTTTIGNKNSATGDDDDDDSDKLLRAWLYGRRHVPWMIARHGMRGDTDGDSSSNRNSAGESNDNNNQTTTTTSTTTPAQTPADHVLALLIQDAQMMAHEVSKNIADAYHQNMHQDGDDHHDFSPFSVFSSIFFPNPKKDHQDYDVSDSTNNSNQATSSLFSSFVDELWNHVNSAHERPPFCSYPSSRNDKTMESSSSNNNSNDGDRDCLAMPRLFRSSRHPYVDGDNEVQQQQQQHTAVDGNPNESNVDVGGRGGVVGGLMRWIKNDGDSKNKNENRNLLNVNSKDNTQTTNADAPAATPSTVPTTADGTATNRAWIQQVLGACNAMSKGGTNELDRLDRFATEYERIQHNHPSIANNSSNTSKNNHNGDSKNRKNENAVGMLQAFQLCLALDNLGKQVPAGATATLPSSGANWHRPLNK